MSPAASPQLVSWALGTFHASLFVVVLVIFLYSQGTLASLLQGLNTALGLALFAALWATTLYTSSRALRGVALAGPEMSRSRLLSRGVRFGTLNGLLFLAVLLVASLLSRLLLPPAGNVMPLMAVLLTIYVGSFAILIAFAIGGLTGLVVSLVDLVLLGLADRLAHPAPTRSRS